MITTDKRWDYAFIEYFSNRKFKIKRDLKVIKHLGILNQAKNIRILELFCGRGECQGLLRDAGYQHVFGLDISQLLVSQARQDCCVQICNSLDICYRSDSFDLLFVTEGFHHLKGIEQIKRCFDEIKRVVRKDGILAFYEPANTLTRRLLSLMVFSPLSNLFGRTRLLREILTEEMIEYSFWLKNTPQILRLLEDMGLCIERYNKTLIHMIVILRIKDK